MKRINKAFLLISQEEQEMTYRTHGGHLPTLGFPCGSAGKGSVAMWETWVQSLSFEEPLEKGKATHCSILTWRIPWTV